MFNGLSPGWHIDSAVSSMAACHAQCLAIWLQQRIENRRHALEHLHRQRRGEGEVLRSSARYKRCQRAEVMRADIEHKGRRTVDLLGAEHAPTGAHGLQAVITGAGLATHGQRCTVRQFEAARHAFGGAGVHHLGQGPAQGRGDFAR